jgi:murein DD-endopeptidase MepM/ murein hydrolase activator NlpD
MPVRFLESYPFKNIGVTIAEGFSAYDGNLRDVPGRVHNAIDYVLKKSGEFVSFEVFSMYEGHVKFGVSESWGKYFIITKILEDVQYDTVYAHLDNIPDDIQKYAIIQGDKDFIIPAQYCLGMAGKTGDTKSIRQLHIELHEKNLKTGLRKKLDPYGIYDRLSSGKYPQPGALLTGPDHYWISDEPEFIA